MEGGTVGFPWSTNAGVEYGTPPVAKLEHPLLEGGTYGGQGTPEAVDTAEFTEFAGGAVAETGAAP